MKCVHVFVTEGHLSTQNMNNLLETAERTDKFMTTFESVAILER